LARRGPAAEPGLRAGADPRRAGGEGGAALGHGALLRRGSAPLPASGGGDPGGDPRRPGDHLHRHRLGQEPHLPRADRRPRAEEPAGAAFGPGAGGLPDECADQQPARGARELQQAELAGVPGPLRPLHRAGPGRGAQRDHQRPAAHPAHQLRDARVHADPPGGADAGRPHDARARFPGHGRAARLSGAPGGGRRHAAAPGAPARRAPRSGVHRHLGDHRHRWRPHRASGAHRRGRAEAVRGRGPPGPRGRGDPPAGRDRAGAGRARGARRGRPGRATPARARSGQEPSARRLGGGDLRPHGPRRGAGAPRAACVRGGPEASGRGDWSRPRAVPRPAQGRARGGQRRDAAERRAGVRVPAAPVPGLGRQRLRDARGTGGARALDRGQGVRAQDGRGSARRCWAPPTTRSRARDCSLRSITIHSGVRPRTFPTAGLRRAPGSRASKSATGRTCPSTSGCARTGWSAACRSRACSRAGSSPSR